MSPHVNYGISLKNILQVGIERGKAMMRRSALRHQQPHGIVFKSKGRLQSDKDISERNPLNQQIAAKRIDHTGRSAPLRFDLANPGTNPQIFIDRHSISDVSCGVQLLRISSEQQATQSIDTFRHIHAIALIFQSAENVEKTGKDVQIGGRADVPLIWRKTIERQRELQLIAPGRLQAVPSFQTSRDAQTAIFQRSRLDSARLQTAKDKRLSRTVDFRYR